MYKFLIAEDHHLVSEGFKKIIQESFLSSEIDMVASGSDIIEKLRSRIYDLLILDISLPGKNGLEVLKQVKACFDLNILVVSMHPEEQYALRVLKLGASGYLSKDAAPETLNIAINRILQGRKYISEHLAELLATDLTGYVEKAPHQMISDREFQVLCLLAAGKGVTEIANELCLSVPTISTYRMRILEKLNLKNNADLIHYALQQGLVVI